MCRWAAYVGEPIFLEEIVSRPGHSLIHQSHGATQGHTAINADGFGIAWYGEKEEPGIFRDVLPAWSDPNLKSLTALVKSHLFMAHVRASTGTATSRNNCHPFAWKNWTFMHNGQVGGYEHFRREADMLIPDALYPWRRGATDSEALFLITVSEGLETDPLGAMERASARLITLARQKGAHPHLRMTAALSDGKRLFAVRYSSDERTPSLYHRWSETRLGRAVVSEPLEDMQVGWEEVPPNSFCVFEGNQVERFDFYPCRLASAA